MRRSLCVIPVLVASAALLAGCAPSGPLTLEQVNVEFSQKIEPDWEVEVSGIYGEPAFLDDLMAVYATDEEVGLRLELRSVDNGELLWHAPASPGGAWGSPIFQSTDSVWRTYPIPTMQPLLLTRGDGEDAQPVVVYFERPEDDGDADSGDHLHVVDARTGEDLELSISGYDPISNSLDSVRHDNDNYEAEGPILAVAYSPGRVCGKGPTVCFEEPDGGYIRLNLDTLELSLSAPEFERWYQPEWGPGFAHHPDGDTNIARVEDGEVLWERASPELFQDERTSPPSIVEFIRVGDLTLIQGYQPIQQTPEFGNQLNLDYIDSRRVVAVDTQTGDTRWMLTGGDALCYAVADFPRDPDATVLPMCLATGGFFSYRYDDDQMLDEEDPVVSIVGVNVADGSIEWEVAHAGELSVSMVSRQIDWTFAQGARFSPVYLEDDTTGLVDLKTGDSVESPEGATFLCESERPGIVFEFDGGFAGGRNPLASDYPAGWFAFPCDAEGSEAGWSKGSVRTGGYEVGNRRIVLIENGIAAFTM